MATQFRIPGNIKQQFLPFVLNPKSDLHKSVEGFSGSNSIPGGTGAQCFSFRNGQKAQYESGYARLQICPSSLTGKDFGNYFNQDISYRLLYKNDPSSGIQKTSITIEDIFDNIPGIQIREFLPDTKLDQCINFFGDMLQKVKDIWGDGDQSSQTQAQRDANANSDPTKDAGSFADKMKKIKYCLWHAFDYLTGTASPNNLFVKGNVNRFQGNGGNLYNGDDKIVSYVLSFPYTLYYRLQSCVTTNVYVLPCKPDDMKMYSSNGDPGWKGNNLLGITNTFLGKIPGVGDILKNILGNVQVNFMPWWDAEKGSATPPEDVTVKFELFNDTAEAAMKNFIFVNTIVPNNMWIQYGMFQHSSNLYDIKLEGYNRLFACTGKFDVVGKGVLRNPNKSWIEDLCKDYGNKSRINTSKLADTIIENNIIKIPDIYQVTMTFSSLLPANFNNYLFTYSQNNRLETACQTSDAYTPSDLTKVVGAATTDFIEDMKKYIQSGVNKDIAEGKYEKKAYENE